MVGNRSIMKMVGNRSIMKIDNWEPLYYTIIQNKRKREFLKCLNVNTYVQMNYMKLLTTIDRQ